MDSIINIIPGMSAVAAAFWGIYVYSKQQRFKRLQNLSQIFQRFADNKNDFLEIFALCDSSFPDYGNEEIQHLAELPAKSKLQYLALLEDVALYADYSKVDRNYAIHLFQWQFYYIYNDAVIARAFWSNLGGVEECVQSYWSYQKKFSGYCNPEKQRV
ncbi:MAG: hypothetical protein H7257_12625 [Taibaiella sp.]|nr:hypothetical protein [Taibaiella sp.]